MEEQNLQDLKKEYISTPIPAELDFIVRKTIKENSVSRGKRTLYKGTRAAAAVIAVCAVILITGLNTSPAFALTLSKIPVLNGVVKVLTFREYTVSQDHYNADIKVPAIQGLDNKTLEQGLNEKYLAEDKKLYDDFMAEIKTMKKMGDGNLAVSSGYIVKTDTDRIFSIERYVVKAQGSSDQKLKFDTVDKKNQVLITLPSLFKDDSYLEIISNNIKSQMLEQMKTGEGEIYWVAAPGQAETSDDFKQISAQQNFYINAEGKLVISFDKYEVAPGVMGSPEFVIPTEALANILVSNDYIK